MVSNPKTNEVGKQNTNQLMSALNRQSVLLQTVNIEVSDDRNTKSVTIKVLFDSGSMKTYVTKKLVEMLQLEPKSKQEMYVNSFGSNTGKLMDAYGYNLCLKGVDGSNYYIKGSSVPDICAPLCDQEAIEVVKSRFPFLENLLGGSVGNECANNDEIDLLIGGDYYWSFVSGDSIRLNEKLVVLNSKFGYILSGPVEDTIRNTDSNLQIQSKDVKGIHVLKISEADMAFKEGDKWSEKVDRFWELDSLGILADEESVYEKFESSIKFVDGRYEVKLPFKENHPIIEDNYMHSLRRLQSLKKKLEKTPGMMKAYDDVIKQQLNDRIVEKIDPCEKEPPDGSVTYLPHRAVFRDDKSTKLRIVYDPSTKINGCSLNECLYKGPCLTPLIFDALLNFRWPNIAITADIEKAYLQISVFQPHRDFLRFLWFEDIAVDNPKVIKCRFRRVLFGANCSQYLLNTVVRIHVDQYKEMDPDFVEKLRDKLYVDDLTSGASVVAEGMEFYEKSKTRFAEGQFNLRKWRTNNVELRSIIAEKEGTAEKNLGEKVLGVTWDEEQDILKMNFGDLVEKVSVCENVTKRSILKVVASCFDPLGLAQPLIVQLKIIFQEACKLQLKWDDPVSAELRKKWIDTLNAIKNLGSLIFPRCYCYTDVENPVKEIQIIGFCDASLIAYGCCVYFKFVKMNGNVQISLVAAKSRIAPLKTKLTIPRLELMGTLLLSRLICSVVKCFSQKLEFQKITCYTDSMICLSWIRAVNKEFKIFVQNRVLEVRQKIDPSKWFYCPSESNPADIITRLNVQNMTNKMWMEGPSFLSEPLISPEVFPDEKIAESEDYTNEVKKNEDVDVVMASNIDERFSLSNIITIENYSNILKLFRVTAYVVRFVTKLRKLKCATESNSIYCTAVEINNARLLWVKENQKFLMQNNNYDQMKIQLNIVADDEGILRARGQMKNVCLAFDAKAQTVLCKDHHLSKLIVEYCHLKVLHNGVKQTVVEIRSRYYISKIRQFVKKCLRLCIVCKKINSRPIQYPSHSDVPKFRFDDAKPFSSMGVDYLGPLLVLPVFPPYENLRKVHVVLYTCAATRGVFLNIVGNLSSAAFINSLRRFIAERGVPRLIVSDNGSAFTAAETQSFVSDRCIRWQFNLEATPWWGGFFESLVKSVKNCLKKILGLKRIDYVELETVLKEIQLILNNRPLCEPVDEDFEFLTPNSILFGRRLQITNDQVSINDVPEESVVSLGKRYKYLLSILHSFWKKWRQEYLISLRDFHAKGNHKIGGSLELDDLVIVEDEKLPRHRWKLGRVVKFSTSG